VAGTVYPWEPMLGRAFILAVVLGLGVAPAGALAASRDAASTNAYLAAAASDLSAAVASMHTTIQASIDALNSRYASECPRVGAGSPQDEEADAMTFEVAGALWSTAYHADARIVESFVNAVAPLRWSNPKITRDAHAYAASFHELAVLPLPNMCAEIRAWSADGFKAIPAATTQFVRHLESINGQALPLALLAPYEGPAQRALATRVAHLESQFDAMETMLGQVWWDMTLETLGLPQ
jgi:hypothetical protein